MTLLAAGLIVGGLSTIVLRALAIGGQAYYAALTNLSVLGVPLPSFGPLPIVNLPPDGTPQDAGLPSINVGVPITGPTVFSAGAIQVHTEGSPTSNTVLSRATSGQLDLFPVPIVNTTGLLRAAGFELECALGPTGFTSHAAVAGIESTLLPAGVLNGQLWADPPPNTGLTIDGLGSVFLHEVTQEQVGNLTVYRANGVRISLNTALVGGAATGDLIWGHVECAAERPIPTSVSPTSGAPGTVVTITGTGFRPDATVDFAGVPATSVTFVSATELQATVPTMLGGTWSIHVTTPVDSGTLADAFTTNATPPGIPSAGFAGDAFGVQLSLVPAAILGPISFGPRPVASLPPGGGRDTDTLVDIPALPGGELIPGGLLTTGLLDTLVQGSPASAPNPTLLAQNSLKDINIGSGLLQVTDLLVKCELGPTGLTGTTDLVGISSTIIGGLSPSPPPNFGIVLPGIASVVLNEQIDTTTPGGLRTLVVNAIHLTINVPLIATGDLIIGHTSCSVQAPTVTSVAPNTGPASGGTLVTFTGTGFGGTPTVTFGGVPATDVTVVNATTMTAITPPHAAGPVDVVVTEPTGTATLPGAFTYTAAPAPTVTSIAPTTGPTSGGTFTTITGTGFDGAPTVTFGGAPATGVTVVNATTITAITPPHAAGPVDVVVTLPSGSGTLPAGFTYAEVADLTVTVTGPSTASPGAPLVFTIQVTNTGTVPATGVQVDLPTPPGLTFTSNSGACATPFPCALGTLDPGASATITSTFDVPSDYAGPDPIVATVTASSPDDPIPGNNSATVQIPVLPSSNIVITMTVDNPNPSVGTNVTFTVTAANEGPLPATGVQVIDKLPAGLTFVSATPAAGTTYDPLTGLWTVPTIPVGVGATLQLVGTVAAPGVITNTATKTGGDQFDPSPGDNVAAVSLNAGPTADVRLTMRASVLAGAVGTPVTFTIEATNVGPNAANGVIVNDLLPAGLTFMSATPSAGTYDSASGNWTVGPIAIGATVSLDLGAVIATLSPVTNIAQKTAQTEFDPSPTSDRAGVTINGEAADLQLIMTLDPSNPAPGTQVTVTLILTNLGPGTATGVDVTHAMPSGLTFVSFTPPDQGSYSPATNVWTVGTMPASGPDATATLQIVGVIPPTGPTPTAPIAEGDQPDPNPTNNSPGPIVLTPPGGGADLDVDITRTGDLSLPGSPVDFLIDITNVGTVPSNGPITVALLLPPNVTITTPPAGWTCVAEGLTYTCTRNDLVIQPGQKISFTIGGTVGDALPNTTPVTVVVTSPGDPNPTNNIATFPPSPTNGSAADLQVTQSGAEGPAGTLTINFRVTNNGPAQADGVTLVDPLPANVTLVSASSAVGPCTGTTTVICNLGAIAPSANVMGTIVLTLPPAGVVTHTLSVGSLNPDPDLANSVSVLTHTIQGSLITDGDGDGMPDVLETQFGLDTSRNDANEDPDGDGRTNAQELADGTHPRGFFSRYFAEGANGIFFDTNFLVVNTDPSGPARALVRSQIEGGGKASLYVPLLSLHRADVNADSVLGTIEGAFSTVIESDVMIAADRVMSWDNSGYGMSIEAPQAPPATIWYFAEGATHGNFDLFYLLQNPSQTDTATVSASYLPLSGPPVTRSYSVGPLARLTIHVDDVPGLAEAEVGAVFTSTNGVPIVAERAMYVSTFQTLWNDGSAVAGATAPSDTWFIAEAATGAFFDAFLLMANPGTTLADVAVRYQLESGETFTKPYSVGPQNRLTFNIAGEDPRLAGSTFSMTITSTQPIIAERAMWWPGPQMSPAWYGAHASMGSTTTATRWAIAGGANGLVDQWNTFVLIANQGAVAGDVRVTAVFNDGTTASQVLTLPATSRTTVDIGNSAIPQAANRTFSVIVESLGASPVPLVVDVSRYTSNPTAFWAAGGSAAATAVPLSTP